LYPVALFLGECRDKEMLKTAKLLGLSMSKVAPTRQDLFGSFVDEFSAALWRPRKIAKTVSN
jgi:hypothetical protein